MPSRRALVAIVLVQAAAIVLLAWGAAWLGRDEFRLARERGGGDDDIESASRVADAAAAGLPRVTLSVAAERNVGLETATPAAATRAAPGAPVELAVLDPAPLAEARGRLQGSLRELDGARAAAAASAAEAHRMQGLYDDARSASQRALEVARAQAAADAARARSAEAALDAQRAAARATWGGVVAGWLEAADAAPLERVLAGHEVLLRAAPRVGETLPPGLLTLDGGAIATPLADVAAPAGAPPARARLYRAPGAGLAPGQRVFAAAASKAAPREGAWVPSSAVVWHAGQPWIYLEVDDDEGDDAKAGAAPADAFQRRALAGAERDGARWFVTGLDDERKVVVRGAQVLLSEELKFQIRNENDD